MERHRERDSDRGIDLPITGGRMPTEGSSGEPKQARAQPGLEILHSTKIGRARIIPTGNPIAIQSRRQPAFTSVDGRRIAAQLEIVIEPAVIAAAQRAVAQDTICSVEVNEAGIAECRVGILARRSLPIRQSRSEGTIPPAE